MERLSKDLCRVVNLHKAPEMRCANPTGSRFVTGRMLWQLGILTDHQCAVFRYCTKNAVCRTEHFRSILYSTNDTSARMIEYVMNCVLRFRYHRLQVWLNVRSSAALNKASVSRTYESQGASDSLEQLFECL